jgi:hypothetical protein
LSDNSLVNLLFWSQSPDSQPSGDGGCVVFGFGNDTLMDDQKCDSQNKKPFICLLG